MVNGGNFEKDVTKPNLFICLAEVEYRASLAMKDDILLDYLIACFAKEFN